MNVYLALTKTQKARIRKAIKNDEKDFKIKINLDQTSRAGDSTYNCKIKMGKRELNKLQKKRSAMIKINEKRLNSIKKQKGGFIGAIISGLASLLPSVLPMLKPEPEQITYSQAMNNALRQRSGMTASNWITGKGFVNGVAYRRIERMRDPDNDQIRIYS